MTVFLEYVRDFNTVSAIIRILCAVILGSAIGIQRETKGHAAGLRTHILVCLGAAMTVMTGLFATVTLGMDSDPLRIAAQVVSGIGFIGAGTIMVTRRLHIRGLTTAAGLWATAAIGLACGIGFYEGAVVCTVMILIVMVVFKKFDKIFDRKTSYKRIYIEICNSKKLNSVLEEIAGEGVILSDIDIRAPRSETDGNVGIEAVVKTSAGETVEQICCRIVNADGVAFSIEVE